MTDTHPSLQALNPLGIKHIPDHSVCLDLVETTSRSTSDDTGCILSSVLKHRQPFNAVQQAENERLSLAASKSGIGVRLTFPSQRQTSVSPRGREAANQGFRTLLTKERLIGARDTRAKAQRKVICHPRASRRRLVRDSYPSRLLTFPAAGCRQ
jgi:hypothetical protein